MSRIDKLSILGIRSFDNTRSETIQFFSPLTIISGSNGSGKTTIIECLKYATTGDHPPNTKGGAFIHDPKLAGEREVLAQVKLSFKGTSGAKMVATRSMQLTVKKNVRSMKTLEGHLLMIKDGERIAVSSRVAELDQIMPQYLGVSKAVLDNVVFCHQDESLWPLSEPSVLKKKFDEIFEALKYTKAIDNIKVLRKKQVEELGKLKIIEEQEKINKDRSERAEKRSEELTAEIQSMQEEHDRLNEQLRTAQVNSKAAWDRSAQFDRIVTQLDGKRTAARLKEESIEDAKHDLQEMEDSDDELRNLLRQYDERASMYTSEVDGKMRQYRDVEKRKAENQAELGRKQRDHGRFQAEKDQYDRQLQNRENLVKDTAARHNIPGFNYDLSDEQVQIFMERISKMAREQKTVLERARRDAQQELSEAQTALNRLNEQRSALNQSRENTKAQIASNDQKMQSHNARLSRVDIDEGAQVRLESTLSSLQERLASTKSQLEKEDWDKQVGEAERTLRELEDKKEELDAEVLQASKQAKETAQVDHLRRTLKETQQSLNTMKGAHGDEISKVIGLGWVSDLEETYDVVSRARLSGLHEAEKQRDRCQRELEQVEARVRTVKDDIRKKTEEVNRCESHVREVIGDESITEFQTILGDWETNRETQYGDFQMVGYWRQCREHYNRKNACFTCRRQFSDSPSDPSDSKPLRRRLEKALDSEMSAIEEELNATIKSVSDLKARAPSYETWSRLSTTEIPTLKNELSRLENDRTGLINRLEREHDRAVDECKEANYEIQKLSKIVQNMVKYINDIAAVTSQLDSLSQKHSQSGLSGKGLEDVTELQRKTNEQSRSARKSVDELRGTRDRGRTHLNTLELDVRDAREKLNNATQQLREKQGIEGLVEELMNANREQRESMKQIDLKLQDLAPGIAQSLARYEEIQRRGEERQNKLSGDESKINQSMNQLRSAQNEIDGYIDRQGQQQLSRTEREIENIKQEQSNIDADIHQLTVEINKLKKEEANHSEMKRSIERNLKYRSNLRALEQLRSEIEELESHNAEADRDRHTHEAGQWQTERNRLAALQASLTGQMKSKDDQLSELLRDYNIDFKDAKQKYKEAMIKVVATTAVVEDLGRYGGALDKAIMKYHGLKMDEINTMIGELWQKTYQGTDIDTILIRSDNEGAKGNKTYNYRVCMLKESVEMDMRGRCSAGQKVLASIIIRLALAECFGVNCGLIALDEPTTNLDHENVVALARSLNGIIKARREQSNFQLIVITHDESFVKEMHSSDFCDHYFLVHRNERQKSQIDRQLISEIM